MDNRIPGHPATGTTISHFRILEKLGAGGMGEVYKAEDTRLKRTVALKFLPPSLTCDPQARERLIHEAQAASALQHSNVCVVHDIDETAGGQMFLVMEFLEGEALNKRIERGPLGITEALDIAVQVAQGLSKAHEHGIVHRDIKPANIIITKDGLAKVVDFGLARLSGRTMLTQAGTTLGTLAYMSPEQTRGETADARSDVWSLAVVLYEMIVGRTPFTGDYENVVVYEIANADAKPMTSLRTGVPADLERVITKAMAKSPDERYQHMDEMLVDLRRVARITETSPAPATAEREIRQTQGRHDWKRTIALTAFLPILLVLFFILKPLLFDDILVSEPKPVAVVAFVNQTGDQTYDYLREAIPNLLITSLEQSRYLRVMTWERMNDLLKQMGKADVKLIDKDLGFELCRREGIHAIVIGTFVKAGDAFATDVKVLDVDTKELLKTASARGNGVQSILTSQIDDLSKEIARGIGLSSRRIEASQTQIAEVTTSSMDAYSFFLRGREEAEKSSYARARDFLERAVALDSNFAIAYFYLARTYTSLLEPIRAIQATTKAKALATKAPEKERLSIEVQYSDLVEKNPAKRRALVEELAQRFPQEKRFLVALAAQYRGQGILDKAEVVLKKAIELDPSFAYPVNELAYLYKDQGLYQKSVETLQQYALLSPGDANPYDSMGEILLCWGKLDESIARYQEALRLEPKFFNSMKAMAYVYAVKEDYASALKLIDQEINEAPSPGLSAEAMAWRSMLLNTTGREREARRELERMREAVEKLGWKFVITPYYWIKAWDAMHTGDFNAAREQIRTFHEAYLRLSPQNPIYARATVDFFHSLLSLEAGHVDSARNRANAFRAALPSVEVLRSTLTMLSGIVDAEILLAERKPDSAIAVYRSTPVMGPAMAIGWRMALYNMPPLRDVVPRAFELKGDLDSAIVAYEKLMTVDPSSLDRRWINPLYHYRLATLCLKAGRTDTARAEFKRFLEIWKDADRDRPEYRDAKRQLARL